jgi:hypothetical protein
MRPLDDARADACRAKAFGTSRCIKGDDKLVMFQAILVNIIMEAA